LTAVLSTNTKEGREHVFLKCVSAAVRDWLVKAEFITVGLQNVKIKTTERERE